MILFRPEHVAPILAGAKTQTRRLGDKRWNVGAVHQARTKMLDTESTFARLRILAVRQEQLGDLSDADARAEGYDSRSAYFDAFDRINRDVAFPVLQSALVWVVEFELAEAVAA